MTWPVAPKTIAFKRENTLLRIAQDNSSMSRFLSGGMTGSGAEKTEKRGIGRNLEGPSWKEHTVHFF